MRHAVSLVKCSSCLEFRLAPLPKALFRLNSHPVRKDVGAAMGRAASKSIGWLRAFSLLRQTLAGASWMAGWTSPCALICVGPVITLRWTRGPWLQIGAEGKHCGSRQPCKKQTSKNGDMK